MPLVLVVNLFTIRSSALACFSQQCSSKAEHPRSIITLATTNFARICSCTPNVMMTICKAAIELVPCQNPTNCYRDNFCEKHSIQHDISHNLYKDVEAEWERLKWDALFDSDDAKSKHDGLVFLSIVLVAREAHTDWFYQGVPDPGHETHEQGLRADRDSVVAAIYAMEHGIVAKMTNPLVREVIRSHINRISTHKLPQPTLGENNPSPGKYERREFMINLLDELHTVELLDLNNASMFTLIKTIFSYNPFLFQKDLTTVDWDLELGYDLEYQAFGAGRILEKTLEEVGGHSRLDTKGQGMTMITIRLTVQPSSAGKKKAVNELASRRAGNC
ncbi:hypothetical protein PG997_008683 [Apiospora hydei]|uniref:Uncharacterized protein n=1 Tax=Apiospora hydei TaxID=1337664 RepID=A0ABR1WBI1_9PEZI